MTLIYLDGCAAIKLFKDEVESAALEQWLGGRYGAQTITSHITRTELRRGLSAPAADHGLTVVQAARDHDVSWPVVAAAFTGHAQTVLPARPEPVHVLGIDEVRRGRPRWAFDEAAGVWQTVVDRWHAGFVDLSGRQGLLGQVEGRTAQAVLGRLDQRSRTRCATTRRARGRLDAR